MSLDELDLAMEECENQTQFSGDFYNDKENEFVDFHTKNILNINKPALSF